MVEEFGQAAPMNFPKSRSICYVVVDQEFEGVDQSSSLARLRARRARFAAGSALAVALAAALTLAGCGRKGGLDAPPMAAAGDAQAPNQASGQTAQAPAQPAAAPGGAVAQPPDKRKTFLDWLIN
jgi:predicted small lipoprotein YifL